MTIIVNGSNTPTAGAVGYGDGTNLAFTSAGTTGQFLSSNGSSAPSWVGAPASAMTLISTQTASSSASISWTGLSGYDKYVMIFENLLPATTSSALFVQVGTGSTTYVTSGYAISGTINSNYLYTHSPYASGVFYVGSATAIYMNNDGTTNTNQGYSGNLNLFNMNKNNDTCFQGKNVYYVNSTYGYECINFSGFLVGNSTTKTAIQLFMSSGNITSGTASLYGISS